MHDVPGDSLIFLIFQKGTAMLSGTELTGRLQRIRNLTDAGLAIANDSGSGATREVLVSMLVQTWELCRDVDPNIIIAAGSNIAPPQSNFFSRDEGITP